MQFKRFLWQCDGCGCSVKGFLGICWRCGASRPGGEAARQEALVREEAALLRFRTEAEEFMKGQPESLGRAKRDIERHLRRIELARSIVLTTAPMVAGSQVVDRLGTIAATGEECHGAPIVRDHYGEGYHGERHHASYGELVVFMLMYKARQFGANALINILLTPPPPKDDFGYEASGEAVVIRPS